MREQPNKPEPEEPGSPPSTPENVQPSSPWDGMSALPVGPTQSSSTNKRSEWSVGFIPALVCLIPVLLVGGIILAAVLWGKTETPLDPPIELVRGKPRLIEAKTAPFTFWEGNGGPIFADAKYAVLDANQEREVLQDVKTNAPNGFTIETKDLRLIRRRNTSTIRHGTFIKTETSFTYDEYVIKGQWIVTAPPECPAGQYEIRVVFEELPRVRDRLKVAQPFDRYIIIRVNVKDGK